MPNQDHTPGDNRHNTPQGTPHKSPSATPLTATAKPASAAPTTADDSGRTRLLGGIALLILCAGAVIGLFVVLRGGSTSLSSPGQQEASAQTADAILNTFLTLQRQTRLAEAETVLKKGVEQYPQEQRLAAAFAEFLAVNKRMEEAYVMYERALAIGPRSAPIEFAAGSVAAELNRADRAIEHYAAAQAQDNTDFRYPLYLAMVQRKVNQIDESRVNLLVAGRLNPDEPRVWGTLADIALQENALHIALDQVAKARAIEPENWLWRLIEARTRRRMGQPQEALDLLIAMNDEDRAQPAVLNAISECLGMLGRPDDAGDLYATFSDRNPDQPELAMQAAIWADRLKRPNQALRYAQRAANLKAPGAEEMVARLTGGRPADASKGAPATADAEPNGIAPTGLP